MTAVAKREGRQARAGQSRAAKHPQPAGGKGGKDTHVRPQVSWPQGWREWEISTQLTQVAQRQSNAVKELRHRGLQLHRSVAVCPQEKSQHLPEPPCLSLENGAKCMEAVVRLL